MLYYVMKTGLPMFDACRAYGLAMLIERLAQAADAVEDVTITDTGPLFLVNGPPAKELIKVDPEPIFGELFSITDGWCGTLLTTGRATKAERLKIASRGHLEEKVQSIRQHVLAVDSWITEAQQVSSAELRSSSASSFESLPASIDVAAFKGIRRAKTSGYSEGEQLYVPVKQWAIGLVGGAHFIRWTWAGKDYAGLVATPQSITMRDHRNVKAVTDRGYLCGISMGTVAAHYAIQLAWAICHHKTDLSAYADRYSALVIHTLSYAGQQWKASSGTIFPLEYPMRLIDEDLAISAEVFALWNHVFRWGSVQGNESLALTLAEFLSQPRLESFEQHARVHLKVTTVDEARRPFPPYQEEWMKEVLHHVG